MEFTEAELREIAIKLTITAAQFSRYQRQSSPNESTAATWRALSLLESNGSLRVTEFAQLDRLSQPAATSTLRRVVSEGYAEAVVDANDRRAKQIRLSSAGQEFLASLRNAAGDRLIREFDKLTAEEISAIDTACTALSKILRGDGAESRDSAGRGTPPSQEGRIPARTSG